ncbi:uncharacterized protein LOC142524528 [Primulina tabacum]|uniref:uncharacterized protein LOC142524528 n=1 Tax=Primulina tabacum TaxID=48773 RepID=UPI003F5A10B0
MEVILPSPAADFDLNSARSSPHVTAPSTPKLLGEYYFSAPTSPSHLSQFYKDFDDILVAAGSGGTVPKCSSPKNLIKDDFAFDVSEEWETASQLSAEELFDGGVIKPLKPPLVGIQLPKVAAKKIQGAFSPRGKNRKERTDLYAVATAEISHRGRQVNASKSSSRRAARSLSPIRDGECQYWEDDKQQSDNTKNSSMLCSSKGSKKWRLKDFFLFRSASEGRAAEKDHLKKYTAAYRLSSFRAIDSPGPRKGPVSAHELHYTMNRAVSQDLKKKTFLPYKQGILGRLAFNPAVHALANGFGFSRK